jgi:hypothetical protein
MPELNLTTCEPWFSKLLLNVGHRDCVVGEKIQQLSTRNDFDAASIRLSAYLFDGAGTVGHHLQLFKNFRKRSAVDRPCPSGRRSWG